MQKQNYDEWKRQLYNENDRRNQPQGRGCNRQCKKNACLWGTIRLAALHHRNKSSGKRKHRIRRSNRKFWCTQPGHSVSAPRIAHAQLIRRLPRYACCRLRTTLRTACHSKHQQQPIPLRAASAFHPHSKPIYRCDDTCRFAAHRLSSKFIIAR